MGKDVGNDEGLSVGDVDGLIVGAIVGLIVGETVGLVVGLTVGTAVGCGVKHSSCHSGIQHDSKLTSTNNLRPNTAQWVHCTYVAPLIVEALQTKLASAPSLGNVIPSDSSLDSCGMVVKKSWGIAQIGFCSSLSNSSLVSPSNIPEGIDVIRFRCNSTNRTFTVRNPNRPNSNGGSCSIRLLAKFTHVVLGSTGTIPEGIAPQALPKESRCEWQS